MINRINITGSLQDAIAVMSDGNPGGINVMCGMITSDLMAGFNHLMLLDKLEIYGSAIYVLYADKCHKDMARFLALMECVHAYCSHNGITGVSPERLQEMAADQTCSLQWTEEEEQTIDYAQQQLARRQILTNTNTQERADRV